MSERGVLVFGEGRHELGSKLGVALAAEELSALPRLIHRLLGEPDDVRYTCETFKTVRAAHGSGGKFAKKTAAAVRRAKSRGSAAVAVVIDRDRRPDGDRLGALTAGRSFVEGVEYPPCAVGTAVEAFDAWMIVDGTAVRGAGGDSTKCHLTPEGLDGKERTGMHPKDRAADLLGSGGLGDKYAAIAEVVDLELLERQCPKGFKPFADDVRERIGPAVPPAGTETV